MTVHKHVRATATNKRGGRQARKSSRYRPPFPYFWFPARPVITMPAIPTPTPPAAPFTLPHLPYFSPQPRKYDHDDENKNSGTDKSRVRVHRGRELHVTRYVHFTENTKTQQ